MAQNWKGKKKPNIEAQWNQWKNFIDFISEVTELKNYDLSKQKNIR